MQQLRFVLGSELQHHLIQQFVNIWQLQHFLVSNLNQQQSLTAYLRCILRETRHNWYYRYTNDIKIEKQTYHKYKLKFIVKLKIQFMSLVDMSSTSFLEQYSAQFNWMTCNCQSLKFQTCKITDLISEFTGRDTWISAARWKYQSTMPPRLIMENKSSI